MAVFRIEKTRDYTIMSNHHLKNKALTLKAKGLLSLILSLPDDWDYTLRGLATISVEGIDAIRQGITELEKQGYVVRERVRDGKGCLRGTEYVIYEQPHLQEALPTGEAPHRQEQEQPVPDVPMLDAPALGKPALDNPILDNPTLDKPALGEPTLDNPTQLNTNESNTYPINKTAAANPNLSNPYPSITQGEDGEARIGMGWDGDGLAAAASFREAIEKRIEYGVLSQDARIARGRLDEIVDLMTEVLCAVSPTMSIAGNDYPTVLVQERFRQIGSRHIQYVFECLDKNTSRVRNIKKYLLAVLFNAPSTMDGYYAAKINHDFGVVDLDEFDF